jgi:hypothetical protein
MEQRVVAEEARIMAVFVMGKKGQVVNHARPQFA